MTVRGVILDLDGTLVDSRDVHVRCLRAACQDLGLPRPSAALIATRSAATDLATLARLVGEPLAERAMAAYNAHFPLALAAAPAPPRPGAAEAIEELAALGLALGVCTGRSRAAAALLLTAAGLDVPLLVAREDVDQPKPAPDGLHRARGLLGLSAAEVVFAGDTAHDVRQGEAAGITTYLVGGAKGAALASLAELPALLTASPLPAAGSEG